MAKMTLEELRKLRDQKQSEMQKRDIEGKDSRIVIGMGTCGIAAGAANANDGNAKQCDAARAAQRSRSPDSVGR